MNEIEDDGSLEAIYDALDRGDPSAAADLAREALDAEEVDDPVLRLLWGIALLELDRPEEAAGQLARAVELDPDDVEASANLALSLFRCCRFREAGDEARRALSLDAGMPDALVVHALVLERLGKLDEADALFAKAARLDPQRFPGPVRLGRPEFDAEVLRAGERLPRRFLSLLHEVAVTVEDVPSDEVLFESHPPLDPELLGLFVGVSLADRSHFESVGALPPRILLFKRNLERHAQDEIDLRDEIAVTLYHELGHYLGLDESELQEIQLG